MEVDMQRRLIAITINIRSRRNHLNYTQEYMSFKLNISQNAYRKIVLYQTRLSLQRLYDIAAIFKITPAELMDIL
jgi:transcriptional regulator with XRE-family HTH domain